MTRDDAKPDALRGPLARWSERKRASARGERLPEPPAADGSARAALPATAAAPAPAAESGRPAHTPAAPSPGASDFDAAALPPVESLTFDSDFTVFMSADVDASVKRSALRKLLRDPRFNVMDGLDTYIDDYARPDPIDASTLAQLRHSVATLNPVFDHPQADARQDGPPAGDASPQAATPAPVPVIGPETPPPSDVGPSTPGFDVATRVGGAGVVELAESPECADDDPAASQRSTRANERSGDRNGT